MKYVLAIFAVALMIYSCDSSKSAMKGDSETAMAENDTIRIANDSLEYEIMIFEPGFTAWLVTQPPRGYYGLEYLEIKNRVFVTEYNQRALNPQRYSNRLYPQEIDYDPTVDYGYEVNYLLYNYFVYFQNEYNQNFPGGRN